MCKRPFAFLTYIDMQIINIQFVKQVIFKVERFQEFLDDAVQTDVWGLTHIGGTLQTGSKWSHFNNFDIK